MASLGMMVSGVSFVSPWWEYAGNTTSHLNFQSIFVIAFHLRSTCAEQLLLFRALQMLNMYK